jgi:hypothetical protein
MFEIYVWNWVALEKAARKYFLQTEGSVSLPQEWIQEIKCM